MPSEARRRLLQVQVMRGLAWWDGEEGRGARAGGSLMDRAGRLLLELFLGREAGGGRETLGSMRLLSSRCRGRHAWGAVLDAWFPESALHGREPNLQVSWAATGSARRPLGSWAQAVHKGLRLSPARLSESLVGGHFLGKE